MNKVDFMEGIHILQDNYNQKFSKERLNLYYENIKDIDKNYYIEQIKELVRTNSFIPNIAQIRGEQKKQYCNYKQRDYKDFNWNSLYANKGGKL